MILTKFSTLSPEKKRDAIDFIKKYELICVQFCAAIKKFPEKTFIAYPSESSSSIYGGIILKQSILHCLPFAKNPKNTPYNNDFTSALSEFLKTFQDFSPEKNSSPFLCVNGEKSGSLLILNAFKNHKIIPRQTNDYTLFKLNQKEFFTLNKTFSIQNAKIKREKNDITTDRFQKLFQLQSEYEKEEVLPKFETFKPKICEMKLKNALKYQIILTLNVENKIVSKAQTNAIGFNAVQLGGVFTPLKFRRKKYSSTLIYFFLRKILSLKKIPVLFAKKENLAAVSLYKSLAFTELSDYIIAYF